MMHDRNQSAKVSLFHIGPPKTATTWLFQCLSEHPEIRTSKRDTIHFFDICYFKGYDWYHAQFTEGDGDVLFDPSFSYVCSPKAIDRIHQYNPAAKSIVCIRNPIDRAYSHYWHLRRTIRNLPFSDLIDNYNSFATWVEHGFVTDNIIRAQQLFGEEQVHILVFDDLQSDPTGSLKALFEFAQIDPYFQSGSADSIINPARTPAGPLARSISKFHAALAPRLQRTPIIRFLEDQFTGLDEYRNGVPPDLQQILCEICREEILAMSELTGRDLTGWLTSENEQTGPPEH